jgi:esterase/lipase
LALLHAAQYEVDGVIAINSALKLNNLKVSYVVPTLNAFNEMISYLHAKGINEWIENRSENPTINYPKHPLTSVAEMEKVMKKVDKTLAKIRAPILILQGDNDPVVNPKSAQLIYEHVNSDMKKLVLLPREKHGILKGEEAAEVFQSIHRFIGDVLKKNL